MGILFIVLMFLLTMMTLRGLRRLIFKDRTSSALEVQRAGIAECVTLISSSSPEESPSGAKSRSEVAA